MISTEYVDVNIKCLRRIGSDFQFSVPGYEYWIDWDNLWLRVIIIDHNDWDYNDWDYNEDDFTWYYGTDSS